MKKYKDYVIIYWQQKEREQVVRDASTVKMSVSSGKTKTLYHHNSWHLYYYSSALRVNWNQPDVAYIWVSSKIPHFPSRISYFSKIIIQTTLQSPEGKFNFYEQNMKTLTQEKYVSMFFSSASLVSHLF